MTFWWTPDVKGYLSIQGFTVIKYNSRIVFKYEIENSITSSLKLQKYLIPLSSITVHKLLSHSGKIVVQS